MALTGPMFNGGAIAALVEYTAWAEEDVAQQAMADWHTYLNESLQHPSGYYESTISMEAADSGAVVHDDGVIYNFWLEGIGRRNAPRTRFEGYHSARQAAELASERVGELINPIPSEFLVRMGGRP